MKKLKWILIVFVGLAAIGYFSNPDPSTPPAKTVKEDPAKKKAEVESAAEKEAEAAARKAAEAEAAAKKEAEAAARKVAKAEKKRAEDEACRNDIQCLGDKHTVAAGIKCREHIERLAKFDFEWTDGMLEPKFSHFRWKDKSAGVITFIGDKIKLQNGFGAWQIYTYECDLDTKNDLPLAVRAQPGRL